ncbi:hypothetical protein PLICRDRAFT_40395 [Plicaturopsis crispa FD-325 SS-3]|nr:hypothetical protein PLICRDRAFT_40395 [Plicaturopsis crispa FD-325 SS-3]
MALVNLHDDALHGIIEMVYLDQHKVFVSHLQTPRNRGAVLLPLSMTCRRLRRQVSPWIFQEVYAWPEVWPASICCYFRKLHLRDVAYARSSSKLSINLAPALPTIPTMVALTHVVLTVAGSPPAELLSAIASAPRISSLELLDVRLDNIDASAFAPLRTLDRLRIHINVDRPADLDYEKERQTVDGIVHSLSETIACFEIPGDLIDLACIANASWPRLKTLKLTGHPPSCIPLHMATVVSRMPRLRTLGLEFSSTVRYHIPPYVYCPAAVDNVSLESVVPDLESLSLSNVFCREDRVLDQIPRGVSVLRIQALMDPLEPAEYWFKKLQWQPLSPLSASAAYHVIQRASCLEGLRELSLTLEDIPSPTLVRKVASACPHLAALELQQAQFTQKFDYLDDAVWATEEYVDAIRGFIPGLQVFRISMQFDVEDGSEQFDPHNMCAQYFATHAVPTLQKLGLMYRRVTAASNGRLESWHDYNIIRDPRGESPPKLDLSTWDIIS